MDHGPVGAEIAAVGLQNLPSTDGVTGGEDRYLARLSVDPKQEEGGQRRAERGETDNHRQLAPHRPAPLIA